MVNSSWTPHGSHNQYWTQDNPLIVWWYRFGDESLNQAAIDYMVKDDDGEKSYMSGLLIDSGPRGQHLSWATRDLGTADASDMMQPTSGIAPWANTGSGIKFTGSRWPYASHRSFLQFNKHHYIEQVSEERMGTGPFSFGSSTSQSGIAIMGWIQVPEIDFGSDPQPEIPKTIVGNPEYIFNGGGTPFAFSLGFLSIDLIPSVQYRFEGNSTSGVLKGSRTYPMPVNEPVFLAATIRREIGIEGGFNIDAGGSGQVDLYIGTTTSGLTHIGTEFLAEGTLAFSRDNTSSNLLVWGNDSGAARFSIGATRGAQLPPDTILDEWCYVVDGNMTTDRISHYMNSGIVLLEEGENPFHPDFVPTLPGDDGLVGYWTFDDQTGTNSAPVTSGITDMDVRFSTLGTGDISPIPGVRGGSGIRIGQEVLRQDQNSTTFETRGNATRNNSINYIFPDITKSDAWTWIGWMDPRGASNSRYGGSVGFWGGDESAGNHWTAWGLGAWRGGAPNARGRQNAIGIEFSPSGSAQSVRSYNATESWTFGSYNGTMENVFQLWALVFDFTNGIIYQVRDAQKLTLLDVRVSSISGLSKSELIDNFTEYGFGFGAINADLDERKPYFDDWAIYNRALTLPEMSGYALSGVAVQQNTPFIDTSLKQVYGYWPFSESNVENYDPEGISGIRFNDISWYRHHLTNVSGSMEISATSVNNDVQPGSLQLNQSGAMLSVEKVFTGSILDFSSELSLPPSGFTAGIWMQLPAEGTGGFSGLDGLHHVMGAWGQDQSELSWQLGIDNNVPYVTISPSELSFDTLVASEAIPTGTPFFLGTVIKPSGANITAELYIHTGTFSDVGSLRLIGRDTGFSPTTALTPSAASGFSLFNIPNQQQGFPSGTLFQAPFVYAGGFKNEDLAQIAYLGIANTILGSGSVDTDDPSAITHWRYDWSGDRVVDHGPAQNYLFPINQDGHNVGIEGAIHGSGAVIRQPEYLDTLSSNSQSSGLDLGATGGSWTALTWIKPPQITSSDESVILNKGSGPASNPSGTKIYMPPGTLTLQTIASGNQTSAQNGELAPGEWNHIAVVFDRDNNEFTTVVNGRYAGPGFKQLVDIPPNNSGMTIGGRGDQQLDALAGGSAFSGVVDDTLLFSRALTLPEISGIAANTYNYNENKSTDTGLIGAWISGLAVNFVSGMIGSFIHGQAQDLSLVGGYISGISGVFDHFGGYIHGKAIVSGLHGGFIHGADSVSGLFGHFIHGTDSISGLIGSYTMGARQASDEFDITLTFEVITNEDFDARLGVEKTDIYSFDAVLGVIRITQPPICTIEMPEIGVVSSGLPYELTIRASGISQDQKDLAKVRFTFADFKGAESGTLVAGVPNSGLYEATRVFDTPGWYTVKVELTDSYGYKGSCCRPFLLVPSGSTSGAFLSTLPGVSIATNSITGSAIKRIAFTHALSGLSTTSGVYEYTDFSDQQESLLNSLEMPSGTQFTEFVREHDYTMPGKYCPVWAVSGSWGIVSDSISDGIDYLT